MFLLEALKGLWDRGVLAGITLSVLLHAREQQHMSLSKQQVKSD